MNDTKTLNNDAKDAGSDCGGGLACEPWSMDAAERERWRALLDQVIASRRQVVEVESGYAFRFASDAATIRDIAEWITYERRCCPFLEFELAVESHGGPLWLKLSGPDGVKDLIRAEFAIGGSERHSA
ncbi:MAG: hypothetical protein ACK4S4_11690 [Pyrinomonadaceae bacterium]